MATHSLSDNFASFFGKLNPSATKVGFAAAEHHRVTDLITDGTGPAAALSPVCFLQGSYKQQTAIHDINDVDVVALCRLWYPPQPGGGKSWSRDEIFATIAAALLPWYGAEVEYGPQSTCIKVNATIKVEVLPVVFASGTYDSDKEPFKLFRPEKRQWEDGYARYHQHWLTRKNSEEQAGGNFIPAIKVFKHLRTRFGLTAVSFHIECLLFALLDGLYRGSPADYLTILFTTIASVPATDWYRQKVMTPCGDRNIFTEAEWSAASWFKVHEIIKTVAAVAQRAVATTNREEAIKLWQQILGDDFFPHL